MISAARSFSAKSSAGRSVLLAGQKSGIVFWAARSRKTAAIFCGGVRVGHGGSLAASNGGSRPTNRTCYILVSDCQREDRSPTRPSPRFRSPPARDCGRLAARPTRHGGASPRTCSHSQSASAITVVPGVVFSGTMDGRLRAYSTEDGAVLWDFDTAEKAWDTVNGLAARGGILDAGAPTVANGMLYVNSGYGRMPGQPGNVLLGHSR